MLRDSGRVPVLGPNARRYFRIVSTCFFPSDAGVSFTKPGRRERQTKASSVQFAGQRIIDAAAKMFAFNRNESFVVRAYAENPLERRNMAETHLRVVTIHTPLGMRDSGRMVKVA